jgi:hypothetical protein
MHCLRSVGDPELVRSLNIPVVAMTCLAQLDMPQLLQLEDGLQQVMVFGDEAPREARWEAGRHYDIWDLEKK